MAHHPVGYGHSLIPFEEMREHHMQHSMEPEYARRLFAWLESTNGQIGIGSSWRRNPSNVSAASKAGKSFHQTQRMADGSQHFMAVDLVVRNPGHNHRAPHVHEVPLQGSDEAARWGVHVNVGVPGHRGFESWHMQAIEVDGFQSWVNAGRHRPATSFQLPHGSSHATPAPPTHHVDPPAEGHDGIPKHTLKHGSTGHEVKLLQVALRTWHHEDHRIPDPGSPDGQFGSRTERALKGWQSHVGHISADGIYGPQTEKKWADVVHFLEALDHDSN